mmetsp:Transcript_30733/g.50754  ORF Transcript_30733/g.50754 Transcript_30733/m.50754 type:complete len:81 (-) Transcript_30733:89-331(-)
MWDGRDYTVNWPIIDAFLGRFVANPPETCDEYQQHQQEQITTNKNVVFLTNYTDAEEKAIAVKLTAFEEWLAKEAESGGR